MHELRYFKHVVAMSDNLDVLWIEKCEMILAKSVRWFEALKIYFNGEEEWIFDFFPTKKQASQYVAGELCPPFVLAQMAAKFHVPGAFEALCNRRVDNART